MKRIKASLSSLESPHNSYPKIMSIVAGIACSLFSCNSSEYFINQEEWTETNEGFVDQVEDFFKYYPQDQVAFIAESPGSGFNEKTTIHVINTEQGFTFIYKYNHTFGNQEFGESFEKTDIVLDGKADSKGSMQMKGKVVITMDKKSAEIYNPSTKDLSPKVWASQAYKDIIENLKTIESSSGTGSESK